MLVMMMLMMMLVMMMSACFSKIPFMRKAMIQHHLNNIKTTILLIFGCQRLAQFSSQLTVIYIRLMQIFFTNYFSTSFNQFSHLFNVIKHNILFSNLRPWMVAFSVKIPINTDTGLSKKL